MDGGAQFNLKQEGSRNYNKSRRDGQQGRHDTDVYREAGPKEFAAQEERGERDLEL